MIREGNMKAINCVQYGSPDVLKLIETEKPIPKDNEVLVKIYASSINSYDWRIIRGNPFLVRLREGLFKPKKNTIIYYGNPAGYLTNGKAVVDPLFQTEELIAFLSRQKDIAEVKWTDGVYDRLVNGQRDHPEAPLLKSCRVWQLSPESDIRKRFISLDELQKGFGAPQMADYQTVYDGEVETNDLEALYTKFNVNHPPGYAGHSLSLSDVLELYNDSGSTYHYCDRFGFKEIAFEPPAQTQTMQL